MNSSKIRTITHRGARREFVDQRLPGGYGSEARSCNGPLLSCGMTGRLFVPVGLAWLGSFSGRWLLVGRKSGTEERNANRKMTNDRARLMNGSMNN